MASCRVKLLSILLVGTLVVVPASAMVPPPKSASAQVGSCVLPPGPLGVGFKVLCEAGQIAVLAGPYVEGVSRPMTGLATKVIAGVVALGVTVAPALSTFSSTGATGDPSMEEYLRRARLNELPPDQQDAIMGLAAADEQGKDYLVYDPAGGLTDGVVAIAAGYVDAKAAVYPIPFTWETFWFLTDDFQLGSTVWQYWPAATATRYLGVPLGRAWYVSVEGTGIQTLRFGGQIGPAGWVGNNVLAYFRIVREDGVIITNFKSIYTQNVWTYQFEPGYGYYLIYDGGSAVQAFATPEYYITGVTPNAVFPPMVMAQEVEYSAYQGETPLPVAIKAGVTAAQVAGTTASGVATGAVSYVTNNITNIYEAPVAGEVGPSNWTPELVDRQVGAAESTASNTTGLLEAIQGIPAAIAAIPEGIQAKLQLWSTPTRDVGTELQGLRDLASTKAPVSWGVELQRTIGLWFGGVAACTVVQLPLGFGRENLALELCPSWVGDWTRPLTALLVYLLLAAYAWKTARRVLWGGG